MPFRLNPLTGFLDLVNASNAGDVVGPSSSTDNAVVRFDGTTGKAVQNSGAIVDDAGNITATNLSGTNTGDQTITLTGDVTGSGTGTFATTLATVATGATNTKITYNNKGLVTSGTGLSAGDIPDLSATYVTQTEVGAANGVAPLDASTKIPASYLPSTVFQYQGLWDPSTNTPVLSDLTGTNGFVYQVSVAFAGPIVGLSNPTMVNFQVGNLVIYSGTLNQWQQADSLTGVTSVNGAVGAVTVNAINQLTGDVTAGPASQSQSKAATIAAIQGTTVSGTTGSGNVVFSTSPALVTPDLGTPSALVGTNITGTANGLTAGTATNANNVATTQVSNSASYFPLMVSSSTNSNQPVDLGTGLTFNPSTNNLSTTTFTGTLAGSSSGNLAKATGDLDLTSFAGGNNQSSAADITGFLFANANVRSFKAIVSATVSATSSLFEEFTLDAIQRGADWSYTIDSTGDNSQVVLSVTNSGQVQYTSANYSGFSSLAFRFRALVTSV